MEIKCAWWNTSLAPTKNNTRATHGDQIVARDVIEELLERRKVDLLGMCEISKAQLLLLAEVFAPLDYDVADGIESIGKSKTDTCLLFNAKKLRLSNSKNIRTVFRGVTYKVAQRVEFHNLVDNSLLTVLVSHWPSVLLMNKGSPERKKFGSFLRQIVDSIFQSDQCAQIILMGDYNDEPFDEPLAFELSATRDRHKAAMKKKMIYNPFWHRIGSDRKYDGDLNSIGFCGTYFHHAGTIDRWRTFDQIMVSTALLDAGGWYLDESSVEILNLPKFTPHVFDRKKHFDHFPVALTIKREAL